MKPDDSDPDTNSDASKESKAESNSSEKQATEKSQTASAAEEPDDFDKKMDIEKHGYEPSGFHIMFPIVGVAYHH